MKIRDKLEKTDDETLRYMIRYLRQHNAITEDVDGAFIFTGITSKKQLRLLRACKPIE